MTDDAVKRARAPASKVKSNAAAKRATRHALAEQAGLLFESPDGSFFGSCFGSCFGSWLGGGGGGGGGGKSQPEEL